VTEIVSPVVQVVTIGVDWPSVVAAISGGVVGVAGIYAAWRQTVRTIDAQDGREEVAEKRRIYAKCLAAITSYLMATLLSESAARQKDLTLLKQAGDDSISAYKAASDAVFEASLIGSPKVSKLAIELLALSRGEPRLSQDDVEQRSGTLMTQLRAAMRTDLDEPHHRSKRTERFSRFRRQGKLDG
jgi:hypothetical protein